MEELSRPEAIARLDVIVADFGYAGVLSMLRELAAAHLAESRFAEHQAALERLDDAIAGAEAVAREDDL